MVVKLRSGRGRATKVLGKVDPRLVRTTRKSAESFGKSFTVLLSKVGNVLKDEGIELGFIESELSTICTEKPKILFEFHGHKGSTHYAIYVEEDGTVKVRCL
ncbi:MAG: hypothetical protein ACE5Z5_09375 [Candidatus Bathyarchaeia archaeon]